MRVYCAFPGWRMLKGKDGDWVVSAENPRDFIIAYNVVWLFSLYGIDCCELEIPYSFVVSPTGVYYNKKLILEVSGNRCNPVSMVCYDNILIILLSLDKAGFAYVFVDWNTSDVIGSHSKYVKCGNNRVARLMLQLSDIIDFDL